MVKPVARGYWLNEKITWIVLMIEGKSRKFRLLLLSLGSLGLA